MLTINGVFINITSASTLAAGISFFNFLSIIMKPVHLEIVPFLVFSDI